MKSRTKKTRRSQMRCSSFIRQEAVNRVLSGKSTIPQEATRTGAAYSTVHRWVSLAREQMNGKPVPPVPPVDPELPGTLATIEDLEGLVQVLRAFSAMGGVEATFSIGLTGRIH